MIEGAHRVGCECGSYLRNGRATPRHWGPSYADTFPSMYDAYWAADKEGWLVPDGTLDTQCPDCRKKNP